MTRTIYFCQLADPFRHPLDFSPYIEFLASKTYRWYQGFVLGPLFLDRYIRVFPLTNFELVAQTHVRELTTVAIIEGLTYTHIIFLELYVRYHFQL